MTPLHWAVVINHAEIISLLIDAGAQLEAKDNWEVSACMDRDGRMYYAYTYILRKPNFGITL